ncbi:MAG: M23 family metallopeptidase [Bacteroidales bacterium]|nr:M23 family metallopeptidase [Bacteroidales bacterium]
MHFFRHFPYIFLIIIQFKTAAQTERFDSVFRSPLDIPVFLSGNYGELRSTHFHAGLDIKTQGEVGKNLYAVADGYISRIKIQSGGYGKAIYINHPNGYTTVYGHMNGYSPELTEYIKSQQYKRRKFEIDLYLTPDRFKVNKGDIIGISGNTGRSGGPHLHYEIRETKSQVPVNALSMGFNVTDNISPIIYKLAIYPENENSLINGRNTKLLLAVNKISNLYNVNTNGITLSGKIGFGIEAYDYLNGSTNRCGIYKIKLEVDDTLIYAHCIDKIPFAKARYVRSHIDFEEKMRNNTNIQKLFIDPNNKLNIYQDVKNRGIVDFCDDTIHSVKISMSDAYDNQAFLQFNVASTTKQSSVLFSEVDSGYIKTFYYDRPNVFEDNEIKISMPADALYKNLNFKYARQSGKENYYSDVHYIHNPNTPVHKYYELAIQTKNLSEINRDKALIVAIDDDNKISSVGGEWEEGFVYTRLRDFGKFAVTMDTLPPKIISNGFIENKKYLSNQTLNFIITDDLAGIHFYNGYIDGEWALFEFDAKTNMLSYTIDSTRLQPNMYHQLKIIVEDYKANIGEFDAKFYY